MCPLVTRLSQISKDRLAENLWAGNDSLSLADWSLISAAGNAVKYRRVTQSALLRNLRQP
jgi:hypothetical protein